MPRIPLCATVALALAAVLCGGAGADTRPPGAALILYAAPPSDDNAHAAVLLAASRTDLSAEGGLEARPLATTLFGEAVAWACDLSDHSCAADGEPLTPHDVLTDPTLTLVAVDDLVAGLLYGGPWHRAVVERLRELDAVEGAVSVHVVDAVTSTVLRLDRDAGQLTPVLHAVLTGGGSPAQQRPAGGPVLVVLGGLTAVIGLSAAADQRSQGLEIFAYVEQNPSTYDDSLAAYEQARRGWTSGLIVAGVGGLMTLVGLPVWVAEARRARAEVEVALRPVMLPEHGGGVWIEGRW